MGEQRTGEAREERGDDERQCPVLASIDSHRLGERVLPVDGVEGEADPRLLQPVEDDEGNGDDDEAQVVVVDWLEEHHLEAADLDVGNRGYELEAFRPAERLAEPLPAQPDDLAGRERPDEKVERLHPQQRKAQDVGGEGGNAGAQQHRRRDRNAQPLREQRARVGADPHDHHMSERPLTGQGQQPVAHHHQDVDDEKDRNLFLREAEQVRQDHEDRVDPGQYRPESPAVGRTLHARRLLLLRPARAPRATPSAAR